jgi:hypothetical protein
MTKKSARKPKQRSLEAQSLYRIEANFKPKVVPSKKVYSRKKRDNCHGKYDQ